MGPFVHETDTPSKLHGKEAILEHSRFERYKRDREDTCCKVELKKFRDGHTCRARLMLFASSNLAGMYRPLCKKWKLFLGIRKGNP